MNWIDKKYKDQLGDKSFPKEMKEEGWQKASELLDREFPVEAPKTQRWFSAGKLALLLATVSAVLIGTWWIINFNGNKSDRAEEGLYNPRTEEVNRIAAEEQKDEETMADVPVNSTRGNLSGNASGNLKSSLEGTSGANRPVGKVGTEIKPLNTLANDSEVNSEEEVPRETPVKEVEDPFRPSVAEEHIAGITQESQELSPIDDGEDPISTDVGTSEHENIMEPEGDSGSSISSLENNDAEEKQGDPVQMDSDKPTSPEQPRSSTEEVAVMEEKLAATDSVVEKAASQQAEKSAEIDLANNDWHLSFPEQESSADLKIPRLSNRRFALSLWAGYDFTGKTVDGENEAYLAKRRTEEEQIQTFSTGFAIDYFLDGNWTFSIGVARSEYGEELNYNYEYFDTVHFDGRYDSPSNYEQVVKQDSIRFIDSINLGHWNYTIIYKDEDSLVKNNNGRTSISYIEMPLLVGYRFGGGRVKPWLQSGVSLGIPSGGNFKYLNASGNGLSEESTSSRLATLQWNYLINIGIDCKIARHWSLRASGFGSMHLNSVLENAAVRQRYYKIGGRIGVAYNF